MRIIIPMAGEGKRLRPHTFTLPKPLFPVLEKPVLQWLLEEVQRLLQGKITTLAYVVRNLNPDYQVLLSRLGEQMGVPVEFFEQSEPLGTAHAIYQARQHLEGEVVILFADTIFRSQARVSPNADGAIWVREVDNPRAYGVVQLSSQGWVVDLVEKPEKPISRQAIIGVYYLRQGQRLVPAIEHLFAHDIRSKGEYQLTDALKKLVGEGMRLEALPTELWLDCGSRRLILEAQKHLLKDSFVDPGAQVAESVLRAPYYIGEGAIVRHSVVGPYAVVEKHAQVEESVVSHSLIRSHATVKSAHLREALIGAHSYYEGKKHEVDLGDYSGCWG
ncbi:MAG: sugar phosphate nucleotidyltransferase [Bacteroidia bacterium]